MGATESRVAVVGSVEGLTAGCRYGFDWQPVGWTGRDVPARSASWRPQWLLLGAGPSEEALVDAWLVWRDTLPQARLAVLGPGQDPAQYGRWLRRGAQVYLVVGFSLARVAAALRAAQDLSVVVSDKTLVQAAYLREAEARRGDNFPRGGLSRREREVFDLLRRGLRNPEIADLLTLAVHTVEFHVSNILTKLQAANRTEAVERARLMGL